uniref:FLYWCH-type domain-containing protein n=1 Tax=Cuerna arida TaxID=1464854 RepID=A0A1B6EZX8_9HEMI
MTFIIESTKSEKSTIGYLSHKYRESYIAVKTGDITWRCLGSKCRATVKTDNNRTRILACNNKHSGPHPATMRALSPQLTSTPRTPAQNEAPETENDTSHTSTPPDVTPAPTPTPTCELEEENTRLKSKIDSLNEEMQKVLEHAIESDSRLLQYTNKIFSAKTSTTELANCTGPDRNVQGNLLSASESNTECIIKENQELRKTLDSQKRKITELEQIIESH